MRMQILAIVIGLISVGLTFSTSAPQLIKLKRTRNSSGISLWCYIIFEISCVVWTTWAFLYYFNALAMQNELTRLFQWTLMPSVAMNTINNFVITYVLITKISYMQKAKKLNITELELSKILLFKDKNKHFKYVGLIIFFVILALVLSTIITILYFYGYIKLPGAEKLTPVVIAVNAVGAICWESVSWPQFIKSIRAKDTTGISLAWAICLPLSCTIMFIYDLAIGLAGSSFNYGVICSLIFNGMICNYGILIMKIKNLVNAHKLNMTEVEYTKKVLIPMIKTKKEIKGK